MSKSCWLLMTLFLANACTEADPVASSCKISCATDTECPPGLACGELGLCAAPDVLCSCAANEFIACDEGRALYCNAAANGIATEPCGAPGCNADAQRCNTCVADTTVCDADLAALERCGTDGLVAESNACVAGCIAGTDALDDDRCGHIQPAWLDDICDEPATMPSAMLSGTLDVQNDAECSGGVREVNGTTFCVVRASTITVGDLKVVGTRALALVADPEVAVTGILDVSADGFTSGPGAGGLGAGGASINSSYRGGGGAGFAQAGGAGGGNEVSSVPGLPGGVTTSRLTTERFFGGAATNAAICGNGLFACLNAIDFPGGGGGGGALLIACRGTVNVAGTVDAGGGGGTGGGDHYPGSTMFTPGGAPGGGSGGFVVFQGVNVTITGSLYANGGGGGAGCAGDNCRGLAGSDGMRTTSPAPGGDPPGNTCGGGSGGSVSNSPGGGENTFASASAGSGGGGGSVGKFMVFTPSGRVPTLTPTQASPSPEVSTTSLLVE